MKQIEMYTRGDQGYEEVCAFAHRIYIRDISLDIKRFPDVLFAITEGDHIFGCMGLNTSLHFPLFLNDPRLASIIEKSGPNTHFCEQSVLALQNYGIGLPVLICVTAKYAHHIGMHKVVYAGIEVSQKTILGLGFETIQYGNAKLELLPKDMQPIYETWHRLHNPVCSILDTANAPIICRQILQRFSKKITIGQRLEREMTCKRDQAA